MKNKRPWLSALLNFILPGVGYIYNGKRKFLGYALLIIVFITLLGDFYYQPELPFIWYELFGHIVLATAFAYDAYSDAKKINKKK